jgi:hypothetical protein
MAMVVEHDHGQGLSLSSFASHLLAEKKNRERKNIGHVVGNLS